MPVPLLPSQNKYNCGLSGEKRATPCVACKNSNACMTDAMQIKEPEVDMMEEKPAVLIDADGMVKKCAKGLAGGDCGYKAGDKVCGKCGAMAMQIKETDEEEEMLPEVAPMMEDEEEGKGMGYAGMGEEMPDDRMAKRKRNRTRRMESMGMKSDEMTDDLFICAYSREMKSLQTGSCGDCNGGCISSSSDPDLLEIEGLAEDTLNGKVLDSGYSDEYDMFIVQVERKDGQAVEAYFTGDGELDGWFRIPKEELLASEGTIGIKDAVSLALEAVEGKAASYSVGEFEGNEAYAVEVHGINGKSYDVFVSPNGEVLGYDEYLWDEDVNGKSDDDDLDVKGMHEDEKEMYEDEKGMYTEDERAMMVKAGEALPDGSYPIKNADDLKNAIQAYGRAKDKEAAKAHIMKRAEELGMEEMIPENWSDGMDGEKSAENEFVAALLEFELLAAEEDLRDILGN
jgi:hypothetical protein